MDKFILFLCSFFVWQISTASAGSFEQGISSFAKKDYVQAKKLWQPLAEKGDARAQYNLALLYMHESKSNLQRQKVSKYLAMSRSEGLVDAYFISIPAAPVAKTAKLLPTLATVSALAPKKAPKKQKKATLISDPLVWLNQQQKSTYTLQLATGQNRESMAALQKKLIANQVLKQLHNLYIHKIEAQDQKQPAVRYVLIYGVFDTYEDAQNEIAKLPASIQKSSPWIRQFSALQSIVNAKK